MRRVLWAAMAMICTLGGIIFSTPVFSRDADVSLYGPIFPVGDLKFTIPSKWKIVPVESPSRGGQWRVPPLHGDGDGGEVVAFYFGPGVGGTAKDNLESWIGTMFNAEGNPAAAEIKHHVTGGFKISQVVVFGTYNQVISLPGVPPAHQANYGLLGAVIENPQGNIYWRFTGPEALITATLPLFKKIVDSVKPAGN
jgi:hypothetical protein